ncbi:uncharacterized protein RJT20DRAFT_128749 [Scheffersomyces xylosifermentans]|uniref:uncharacterized protein n=1 Tax=Scheffersomyces xylosifermentans TaxID=1304137 RepID=UPI00315C87CD
MSASEEVVAKARALLQSSQADKALELLAPQYETNGENVIFLQIFGETLLENNQLEDAYNVLVKACELDPQAEQVSGTEKFFYFGQIVGGQDGINALDIGLQRLQYQLQLLEGEQGEQDAALVELAKLYTTKQQLRTYLIKKLNQGIFAKIEIWMTDLCMEEEAEQQCNDLIDFSLSLDPQNPEALSLLASIRISQQRNDEAKESLLKSWELFKEKKTKLEDAANELQNGASEDEEKDSFEVGLEYVELIQPLSTLARFAIELELYDTAITIASNTQDINDSILESYYYEALANLFNAKKIYFAETGNKNQEEDYRDIETKVLSKSKNTQIQSLLAEARSSLTQGFKVINSEAVEDADPGLVEQVQELLTELGGPVMSELMPPRRNDGEEEGWEDEIESEDED